MEHLLQIIFDADCISWYSIHTFHSWCCYYVGFCVYEKFSWSYHFFKIVVRLITYITIFLITFPTDMMPHWCFIEEYFISINITLRVYHRVVFGIPNFSRSSEYLDLTIIHISQNTRWSHSVYNCTVGDVLHILYLTYIYISVVDFGIIPNECLVFLNGL